MKTIATSTLAGMSLWLLAGCDPSTFTGTSAAQEQLLQQVEQTRATYEREAAEMQARGEALQNELAALKLQMQENENAEMQARLLAMEAENQRLLADAEAARKKADEWRSLPLTPASPPVLAQPVVTVPTAPPVLPVTQVPVAQPWMDNAADYSLFYDQLTPHGDWLDVEGYGYAWRPRLAAQSAWRPYTDGRWVWSDHGWAWSSNEPFGWACYHYGRWTRVSRHGWVWIPGREWAPAWVSWRTGPDYIGWAPLPPGPGLNVSVVSHDCDVRYGLSPSSYFFIQSSLFGRSSYTSIGLSITNVTRIFASTVNVTNITVVNHAQSRFFAHRGGPDRDWLERRIGSPLPRAQVNVHPALDRSLLTRTSRDGALTLTAAPLPSGRADRPRELPRISQRISRPEIEDAWSQVPQENRTSLRETITRQAREPRPTTAPPTSPTPTLVRDTPGTPPATRPTPTGSPREEVRPAVPPTPSGRGPMPPTREQADAEKARPTQPDTRPTDRDEDRRRGEAEALRSRMAEAARQQSETRQKMEDAARAKVAQESQQRADMDRRTSEAEALRSRMAEATRQQAETRQKMEDAARAKSAQESQQRADMDRRTREAEALRSRMAEATRQQAETRQKMEDAVRAKAAQESQQRADMDRRTREAEALRSRMAEAARQQTETRQKMEDAARAQQDTARRLAEDNARRRAADQQKQMEDSRRQQMEDAQRRMRDEAAARSQAAAAEAARQSMTRQSALQEAARRQQMQRVPPPTRSSVPMVQPPPRSSSVPALRPPSPRSGPAPSGRATAPPQSRGDPSVIERRSRS